MWVQTTGVVCIITLLRNRQSVNISAWIERQDSDGGIDGIINEDALGLDAVYVQAKRYAPENTIGRPAIQQFVGSLTGEGAAKGVFVTTSAFTKDAERYVDRIAQRIVLIDGRRFASLMIAHGVGVRTTHTLALQEIDENFFSEE